jgi:hypothetical protein
MKVLEMVDVTGNLNSPERVIRMTPLMKETAR